MEENKPKKKVKKVVVDPIAEMVKARHASGLFNVNQLAAQFMVHTSRIEKILNDGDSNV